MCHVKEEHMRARTTILAALLAPALPAAADIDPLSGIDFVTVGAVGNAPWVGDGSPNDQAVGRGQVNYEYRIGKMEITTGQWVEFMNAAFDRPQSEWLPFMNWPDNWGGASTSPTTAGGRRWVAPAGQELRMVGDLTWRQAAIYCNWLHNNKSLDQSAFLTGAYDVSTFGDATPFGFTDQRERSPGARYFIPTWDEWLKAAHYDPNKQNPDGSVGGWWQYANKRDQVLIYGPPPAFGGDGTGMANAGFNLPGFTERFIPLASYPTQQSPWGLLDTAGGMTEWMETGYYNSLGTLDARGLDGSGWGSSSGVAMAVDSIRTWGGEWPNLAFSDNGFRIAAVVPAPGGAGLMIVLACWTARRRGKVNGGFHADLESRQVARTMPLTWPALRQVSEFCR